MMLQRDFDLPLFSVFGRRHKPSDCFMLRTLRSKHPMPAPSTDKHHSKDTQQTTQADAETSQRVLRQFRLVFSAVRRHFQRMEKTVGMGSAQIWALSLIAQNPGLGVTQLAQGMDIHQSTASNLVRALIKSGLVQSEKSSQDKRVSELYPLPAGLKALKNALDLFRVFYPRRCASWTHRPCCSWSKT